MSLAKLKKSSSLQKLTKELDKLKGGSGNKDERFWIPEVDKARNGYAVIRFLDAPFVDGEDAMPWVQVFSHGFQGPGGWYIEGCHTTVGKDCPVCKSNSQLWATGSEANKTIVRSRKRKLNYISNILVVKDPASPENEGKIFLFKYGKKIFDKIKEVIEPQFQDEAALNPFNFWEGANFKLKIRDVEGYRNYDKSEFDSSSAVSDDDDVIEELWKKCYSLKEFLGGSDLLSYEDAQAKLDRVLGSSKVSSFTAKAEDVELEEEENSAPFDSSSSEEEDDTLSFFKKLAQE
jgi:hypothetical protein